ncbi:MAG: acyl-CoA dehydrogenase [Albidovulum sp.]|nr:acyl-CoA dehydrogenase [Albidovulum sp.]
MAYKSPVDEYKFLFENVVGFGRLAETELFQDADLETSGEILEAAGKLVDNEIAPLQRSGDVHPAVIENGVVKCSPGFRDGFRTIGEAGLIGLAADPRYGGMGQPLSIQNAVNEMLNGSCLSLALAPLLSQGQILALERHADPRIKQLYLPRLVSGDWHGTMNLTEPNAGSDVGALKARAEPAHSGSYRIYGQKIFISWGDGDISSNVCHLVLARLPNSRVGTKGISMFLVPKFIPDENGAPGSANGVRTVRLEEKLGLHGSPTAELQYDGAVGWLVGHSNEGMRAMFTMMNNVRLGVGCEGVGAADAAFQQAFEYASLRKQGRTPIGNGSGAIIEHADVLRMLADMKSRIFAARAICASCAIAADLERATGDGKWRSRAAFLTPIAKAFGTQTGIDVSATGIHVHGGAGYIEQTGATQFLRDVFVTAIYEGTNGIQAMDFAGRKLADGGEEAMAIIDEIRDVIRFAISHGRSGLAGKLEIAVAKMSATLRWMLNQRDLDERFAGASSYLRAFAVLLGAKFHLLAALTERQPGSRTALAEFYFGRVLPEIQGLCESSMDGASKLRRITPNILAV